MKERKILVFGITENLGGVESVIMNYYRNINRNNIKFDFLCNTNIVAYEEEIIKLGGKIYRITARSSNHKKYKKEIKKFFKEHAKEYSTIWVNVSSLANIDYLKYAKKYGIKYRIIHSHNSKNMDSKLRGILHYINRFFIRRYATDFWTCSKLAAEYFYPKKIIENNEFFILKNAINVEKFKYNEKIRNEYRKKMDLENKYVIGNIGRFHFQKNQMFLLEIFKEITKLKENAILLLIGEGEDRQKIEDKIRELKIGDKVKLTGVRTDIPELLQVMDMFILPSVFEGFGIVLLEAQAAGVKTYTSKDVVPKDTAVTPYLKYISLKESPEYWAKEILKDNTINREKEKENILKLISEKGYNIIEEAKKVEKFFERK